MIHLKYVFQLTNTITTGNNLFEFKNMFVLPIRGTSCTDNIYTSILLAWKE
jgi:hypothetical protein